MLCRNSRRIYWILAAGFSFLIRSSQISLIFTNKLDLMELDILSLIDSADEFSLATVPRRCNINKPYRVDLSRLLL